jgi:hypothetical protein
MVLLEEDIAKQQLQQPALHPALLMPAAAAASMQLQ